MEPGTPDRFFRIDAVVTHTGLNRSTLYRRIENGAFPRHIEISTRCAGRHEPTIAEWLDNQCSTGSTTVQGGRAMVRLPASIPGRPDR
jgi:prophage regulatory protein